MSEYKKLRMTADKSAGNFVKTLKGQTGTGFAENTHVHKDWYATTISYDDAMENLQRAADDREDILAPAKNINAVVEDGEFKLSVGDRSLCPTDWALQQRAQEDADEQDAKVMMQLANNALRRLEQDKVFRLRTYTDDTCRAFVTDKYAPIDNRWYLDVLKDTLPGGRLSHWRGDEDTIFGNVLLPDTIIDYGQDDDSDYGGMLSIGNCEIGKRRISQIPSLFRSICLNGCIWGQVAGQQIKKRHIGEIDLTTLRLQIEQNIEAQLPLLPLGIRKLLDTQSMDADGVRMKNVIAAVAIDNKFSKREASEVLSQWATYEREDKNLFGVVNAVTRAGQTFDPQNWVRFDQIGGQLLEMSPSRWDSTVKRADSLDVKDFDKVFAMAS